MQASQDYRLNANITGAEFRWDGSHWIFNTNTTNLPANAT